MLSMPQNIRVGRVEGDFLPNMFTEETGFFLLQDIIMKLISRHCNLLNLFFFSGTFFTFTFSFHCKHGESVNLLALIKH